MVKVKVVKVRVNGERLEAIKLKFHEGVFHNQVLTLTGKQFAEFIDIHHEKMHLSSVEISTLQNWDMKNAEAGIDV